MNASDLILQILVKSEIIPEGYTGQIVFHIGQGGMCEVERRDKEGTRLRNRLNGMNDYFLDKLFSHSYNLANNIS
jgi:hypothetical protein